VPTTPCAYDYAVIRVVPRVEREEFINAGVILSCPARDFLDARVHLDRGRLLALCPDVDVELVQQHLEAIPALCRGGNSSGAIGQFSQRQRFHWLVAPRSTIIQTSPVHSGLSADPAATLEHLVRTMVLPRPA
jgi:hypothetical protein